MYRGYQDIVAFPLSDDDLPMDAWEGKRVEAGKSRGNKHLQVGQRAYAGISPSSTLHHRESAVVPSLADGPLSSGTGFNLFTPGSSETRPFGSRDVEESFRLTNRKKSSSR